jgi:hypothetical protein
LFRFPRKLRRSRILEPRRARETFLIVEQAKEIVRKVELILRVKRETGGCYYSGSHRSDRRWCRPRVRQLTFSGGVVAAGAVVVQDDGVVRVLGDSQG